MLILKENAANSVPTPPVGKDTFFIDDSGTPSIKNSAGNVTTFPVVNASNAQVVFMNGSSLSGEAALTYDFNNNILNITGNLVAGNVKTDNLLYANGSPWDLQQPGGSNTQIQFNDADSFGGSAAFTFNKTSNLITASGNVNANNFNATTHVTAGNVYANSGTVGASLLTGTLTTAAQPNVTSVGTLTNLSVSGNAVISGNLTVDGNLVYVNVETVAVEDPIIQLQTGPNGAAPVSNSGKDVGTALNYYDSQARLAFMGWDVSNAEFAFGSQTSITNEVVTFTTLGNARAQTFKGNVEASGTSNIAAVNLAGHIIPTLDDNYDLGNSTNRFRDLWISGNSIRIGNSQIKSNATSLILQNPDGGQLVVSGNSVSSTTSLTNGNSNVNIPNANGNINISATGVANVFVVTSTGANIAGTLNATGNANVGNIGATQGVFTNVSGNGSSLSSLTGANVTGQVSFAATANAVAGANVSGQVGNALVAGTVYTNAQPNITSVGTLSSVAVTGNATAGNVYANSGTIGAQTLKGEAGNLSNITGANVSGQVSFAATANAVAGANVSGQVGNALVAGTVYTNAQPNITSVGTLTSLGVSGNITAANITANTGVFTGNAAGLTNIPGGNITGNISGNISNANYAAFAGQVVDSAQSNITSVGTLSSLTVSGNASAGNFNTAGKVVASTFESNVAQGTAPIVVVSTTKVANLNADLLDGFSTDASAATANTVVVRNADGNIIANNIAGTLVTASQTNITSVGTLTGLGVNGTITGVNITANTGVFTGNANGLSSLQGANVVGTINSTTLGNSSLFVGTTSIALNRSSGAQSLTGITSIDGYAATVSNAAQPNITSVGTLTGLGVNGTVTAVNITANTGVFTGNGSGLSSLAGANVTGQVANAAVAGTVYTAAQPNITSVGTLTSLAVTGNTTAGNVYANTGTIGASLLTGTLTTAAQPNITSIGTLSSLSVTGNVAAGNLTTTGVLSVTGTGVSSIAGNLDMTGNTIINLAEPTNASDAATKNYVDTVVQGLHVHDSCYVGTTDTLANASGGTTSYTAPGPGQVGAYISTTGTFLNIDGANVQTVGTRILVKNEANAAWNGIYTYANTTALVRATDFDTSAEAAGGDFVFITSGSTLADTGWVQTTDNPTLGTSNIVWTQFSGAGTYKAGTGLTLTGEVFSVNASQTQVTALGTVTTGTWNSLVGSSATFAAGLSGANLASITGANVTGTVPAATVAGTVTTAAQPNITSVGTLTSVSITGNATAGNVYANTGTIGASLLTGTLTTAAQPNVTSLGTLTGLGVNGTLTAVNITANTGVFTGNANGLSSIQGANVVGTLNSTTLGNSSLFIGTTSIALNRGTGAQSLTGITSIDGYASTVSTAAQPNITSVGTLTSLTVSGNASAGNLNATSAVVASTLTSNVATGTAPLTVTSTTRVANLNVAYANVADFVNISDVSTGTYYPMLANAATGNVSEGSNSALTFNAATGALSATLLTGTLTTAAQPNVTSVGTLTSLGVSGNITAPNLIANTGFVISSVNAAVSAAGTAQGNATALTREINVTSTVASGAGVALPAAVAGMRVTIINTAANAVLVYPASGGTINSLALNAAFSQAAGARLDFVATSTTQWYTLNATYA